MEVLNEKPEAEQVPSSTGASIIINGRYAPPPADRDGRQWVRASVTVQADPMELYAKWRDLESIPHWQDEIESVTAKSETVSHWVRKHGETTIEWDAETLADEPGKRIAWKSLDADPAVAGEVIFEPAVGGQGTVVTMLQMFHVGTVGNVVATLTGRNPKQGVIENLRHFKALVETGEIPRSQDAPHGDRGVIGGMKRSMYGETVATPDGKV